MREKAREYNKRPEVRKRNREYWKKPENKKRMNATMKKWSEKNKEKVRASRRKYWAKPESKARQKKYLEENREKIDEQRWEREQKRKLLNKNTHEICRLLGRKNTGQGGAGWKIKCSFCSVSYEEKEVQENYFIRKYTCPCCKRKLKTFKTKQKTKKRISI